MIVLIILAAIFTLGMIIMIFDSFNLFRIFKKSPVHIHPTGLTETKMFFRAGKK